MSVSGVYWKKYKGTMDVNEQNKNLNDCLASSGKYYSTYAIYHHNTIKRNKTTHKKLIRMKRLHA